MLVHCSADSTVIDSLGEFFLCVRERYKSRTSQKKITTDVQLDLMPFSAVVVLTSIKKRALELHDRIYMMSIYV